MTHTGGGADESAEARVRAVLDGLRTATKHDRAAVLDTKDAQAILDDAWSMLSQVLAEGSAPDSNELLNMLRQLSQVDNLLQRRQTANRIRDVLTRLETAQCSVHGLVEMAPGLIGELGFDRAIVSRIDEGVWVPEAVFVAGDPQWAEVITRVGREHPQPLTPGLIETQLVRRRQGMIVYDVQKNSRVHRAIAEESQSRSYVAAPIMSGNRVIGMLHGDRYLQGRDIDDADRELLLSFAQALQLALSRASVVEQLQSLGNTLRSAVAGVDTTLVGVKDAPLGQPRLGDTRVVVQNSEPVPTRPAATSQAARSVRDLLTEREFEVLGLVALGRTNAAIASRLVIAEGTVKQHVKHILRKLRVENRAEAVSRLYQSSQ